MYPLKSERYACLSNKSVWPSLHRFTFDWLCLDAYCGTSPLMTRSSPSSPSLPSSPNTKPQPLQGQCRCQPNPGLSGSSSASSNPPRPRPDRRQSIQKLYPLQLTWWGWGLPLCSYKSGTQQNPKKGPTRGKPQGCHVLCRGFWRGYQKLGWHSDTINLTTCFCISAIPHPKFLNS